MQKIEKVLKIQLPTEYQLTAFKAYFEESPWEFWEQSTLIEKNIEYISKGYIKEGDFAFASLEERDFSELLFYRAAEKASTHIYSFCHFKENDSYLESIVGHSFSKFLNLEFTNTLQYDLDNKGYTNVDISQIDNCIDSLFSYAMSLHSEEGDEFYSAERQLKSEELLFRAAEGGNQMACRQIARGLASKRLENQMQQFSEKQLSAEEIDINLENSAVKWYKRAILFGDSESIFNFTSLVSEYGIKGHIDELIARIKELTNSLVYRKSTIS